MLEVNYLGMICGRPRRAWIRHDSRTSSLHCDSDTLAGILHCSPNIRLRLEIKKKKKVFLFKML